MLPFGPYSTVLHPIENLFPVYQSAVERFLARKCPVILRVPDGITAHHAGFSRSCSRTLFAEVMTPDFASRCLIISAHCASSTWKLELSCFHQICQVASFVKVIHWQILILSAHLFNLIYDFVNNAVQLCSMSVRHLPMLCVSEGTQGVAVGDLVQNGPPIFTH